MAWDEWEELKANAAARGSARMQLNGYTAADHGSGGGLVVKDDELGKLGNMAYNLREQLRTDGDHARPATHAAATELFNDSLDMGAALTELHDAWNSQLKTLVEACGQISNHIDFSRAKHGEDEAEIRGRMSSIATLDQRLK